MSPYFFFLPIQPCDKPYIKPGNNIPSETLSLHINSNQVNPPIMSAAQHFFKHYFRPEVTPLVVIIGGALGGATYVASHAARAPDVVWDHKSNTRPWQDVKQGDQVKFWHTAENPQYTQRFKRPRW
ncbi:hypothetical protein NQZ79_g8097 [Umbelopsis isabellina]|nr:hypothetical protein NQZ79_g8097 [Umbelopsis isabellina]